MNTASTLTRLASSQRLRQNPAHRIKRSRTKARVRSNPLPDHKQVPHAPIFRLPPRELEEGRVSRGQPFLGAKHVGQPIVISRYEFPVCANEPAANTPLGSGVVGEVGGSCGIRERPGVSSCLQHRPDPTTAQGHARNIAIGY